MNNFTRSRGSVNVLPITLCNRRIDLYDSKAVPKKLSSLQTFHALLPDPMLMRTGHMEDAKTKKAAKSFCSLDLLLREAHKLSAASAAATCSSSPKLNHRQHWKPPESRNTSMKNAVFDANQTSKRRRPLRARSNCINRLMRNELLLDDCGSLIRRIEEYHQQKKISTFIPPLDSDSDDDDLE